MYCLHIQERYNCSNYTASHSTRASSSNFRLNTEVDRLTAFEGRVLKMLSAPKEVDVPGSMARGFVISILHQSNGTG
jgi:hypothetical protein